jgi:hypothetical protein
VLLANEAADRVAKARVADGSNHFLSYVRQAVCKAVTKVIGALDVIEQMAEKGPSSGTADGRAPS